MGVADRMKDREKEINQKKTSEENLRDTFNDSAKTLIMQFMAEVKSGSIQIDDVADLSRLFQIYSQVNDLNELGSGQGSLPQLSPGQRKIMNESMETKTRENNDGEEEEVVSLESLENMADEQIDEMLKSREVEMNKENEESFE